MPNLMPAPTPLGARRCPLPRADRFVPITILWPDDSKLELEPSEFALVDTIRGTLAFVRERAARHSIDLTEDLAADLGTVAADERKVRQVLLNLLSNAV